MSESPETIVRVLPETWAGRVSEFIRSAGSGEQETGVSRPQMLFARVYLPTQMGFYSDFNLRSRHFRCIENVFVETDANDEILSVVTTDGMRSAKQVLNVNLIVCKTVPEDVGGYLSELLDRVLTEAAKYCAAKALRFTYIYDTSFQAPLGVKIIDLLVNPTDELPLVEEARIPNETGRDREAVLISFRGTREQGEAPAAPGEPAVAAGPG